MKKILEVNVTQKDINKADPGETNTCAIAMALIDEFGLDREQVFANKYGEDKNADYVSVDSDGIEVRKRNGFNFDLSWKTVPSIAVKFIKKFDEDKSNVKPFSFKLPFFSR